MQNTDPKVFWEKKIRTWESGRYETEGSSSSLLEAIANRASNSLRNRVKLAGEILSPIIAGKRVAEIGCGSGLLTRILIDAGAAHYQGFDIADTAIKNACNLNRELIDAGKAEFKAQSISQMPKLDVDVVFSLGLLDWLQDEEIAEMFQKSGKAEYLHAIAERRLSLQRFLHQAYVYVSYGHKTGSYVPRYFKPIEIKLLADHTHARKAYVYRTPLLSFGAFIASFAFASTVKING